MDIVLRATVMFFVLYGLLRLMGKRELAQLAPFELVMLIVLGDLIQQGVTHNDFSLTGATLAIATFAFWALVLSWITWRWRGAERALASRPLVLVAQGRLLEDNLKRDRVTRSELESEMRMAGIARLADVEWAILEPQGKISFIGKPEGGEQQGGEQEDARPVSA